MKKKKEKPPFWSLGANTFNPIMFLGKTLKKIIREGKEGGEEGGVNSNPQNSQQDLY